MSEPIDSIDWVIWFLNKNVKDEENTAVSATKSYPERKGTSEPNLPWVAAHIRGQVEREIGAGRLVSVVDGKEYYGTRYITTMRVEIWGDTPKQRDVIRKNIQKLVEENRDDLFKTKGMIRFEQVTSYDIQSRRQLIYEMPMFESRYTSSPIQAFVAIIEYRVTTEAVWEKEYEHISEIDIEVEGVNEIE